METWRKLTRRERLLRWLALWLDARADRIGEREWEKVRRKPCR